MNEQQEDTFSCDTDIFSENESFEDFREFEMPVSRCEFVELLKAHGQTIVFVQGIQRIILLCLFAILMLTAGLFYTYAKLSPAGNITQPVHLQIEQQQEPAK